MKSILASFGNTVPTYNKHFSHSKHTLFALTKMCLFGEEANFGKINSLHFFIFLRYWQHFLFFKFEIKESFSPILQTKNPLEMLETFFMSEKFFSKALNKKFNSNT